MLVSAMSQVASIRENAAEATDPRILRSRRMLMEAWLKLLHQKAFDDISIQEIADEATLNRATFYLHYPRQCPLAMTAPDLMQAMMVRAIARVDLADGLPWRWRASRPFFYGLLATATPCVPAEEMRAVFLSAAVD
jgi:AcrR family transcriptional regulator